MTTTDTLKWIKLNLGPIIQQALDNAKLKNPQLLYTPDWLAGITMRETGFLIQRYVEKGGALNNIAPLMRGDYTQRPGETEKQYHGYGFIQIDIASYPDFIRSGDWKDPLKSYSMAISVLEGKRMYLQHHFPALAGDDLDRAITAAYNCGEGNVGKVITEGHDIDIRTYNHDYSKNVWEYRRVYNSL